VVALWGGVVVGRWWQVGVCVGRGEPAGEVWGAWGGRSGGAGGMGQAGEAAGKAVRCGAAGMATHAAHASVAVCLFFRWYHGRRLLPRPAALIHKSHDAHCCFMSPSSNRPLRQCCRQGEVMRLSASFPRHAGYSLAGGGGERARMFRRRHSAPPRLRRIHVWIVASLRNSAGE